MITLKDSIEIKATPEKVFERLIQCLKDKESYKAWHPEHVDIRWIKGEPLMENSIMYVEEYLHRFNINLNKMLLFKSASHIQHTSYNFSDRH